LQHGPSPSTDEDMTLECHWDALYAMAFHDHATEDIATGRGNLSSPCNHKCIYMRRQCPFEITMRSTQTHGPWMVLSCPSSIESTYSLLCAYKGEIQLTGMPSLSRVCPEPVLSLSCPTSVLASWGYRCRPGAILEAN
jgi:hypothetical protein